MGLCGSAVAVLNIRKSGEEVGLPSGSVVPLPTTNSHAKGKKKKQLLSDETCIPETHVYYIKFVGALLENLHLEANA